MHTNALDEINPITKPFNKENVSLDRLLMWIIKFAVLLSEFITKSFGFSHALGCKSSNFHQLALLLRRNRK